LCVFVHAGNGLVVIPPGYRVPFAARFVIPDLGPLPSTPAVNAHVRTEERCHVGSEQVGSERARVPVVAFGTSSTRPSASRRLAIVFTLCRVRPMRRAICGRGQVVLEERPEALERLRNRDVAGKIALGARRLGAVAAQISTSPCGPCSGGIASSTIATLMAMEVLVVAATARLACGRYGSSTAEGRGRGVIRKPKQAGDLEAARAEPVLCDLEGGDDLRFAHRSRRRDHVFRRRRFELFKGDVPPREAVRWPCI